MEPTPISRRFDVRRLLDAYAPSKAERRFHEQMDVLAAASGDVLSAYFYEPGHFTASAFVLDSARTRLLLIHHRKLDAWLQPGGHIDPGDESIVAAARREVREETGVAELSLVREGLFDVDVHRIPAAGGTPPHLHHDMRFLFVAADDAIEASSEVRDAAWVPLGDIAAFTTDRSVRRAAAKIAGTDRSGD